MSERLYPVPDNSRTPWCFLVFGCTGDGPEITEWEIAAANANQIVETKELCDENSHNEVAVLSELMHELNQYQHEDAILYTTDEKSLLYLRTRFQITIGSETPSFRGFRHVSIQEILELFGPWYEEILDDLEVPSGWEEPQFDGSGTENSRITAHDLWKVRSQLGPLIPQSTLQGEPL